jgi:hypothetical protein
MTTEAARTILGQHAEALTDEELGDFIAQLETLADIATAAVAGDGEGAASCASEGGNR